MAEMNLRFNSKYGKGKGTAEESPALGNPSPTAAHEGSNFTTPFISEIAFPRFDGSNPSLWITKCNAHFHLFPHYTDSQKVALAYLHFEGKADWWLQYLPSNHETWTWSQFLDVVCVRFEKLTDAIDVTEEFNNLRQTGSYLEYVETFQDLKARMLKLCPGDNFSERFFVDNFVSGLSEDLKSSFNNFAPTSLHHAIQLGRSLIQTIGPPIKLLTAREMAARIEKDLCYNCDEVYVVGHRGKKRIGFVLMAEEEELALKRVAHSKQAYSSPMSFLGEINGHVLHILIASASTLS